MTNDEPTLTPLVTTLCVVTPSPTLRVVPGPPCRPDIHSDQHAPALRIESRGGAHVGDRIADLYALRAHRYDEGNAGAPPAAE